MPLISHPPSSTGFTTTSTIPLSRSLVDRWGATDDLATSSLHSSHLSVFLMAAPSVHSGMLSSHLFFLSVSPSPSLYCALQDCLGKPWRSCYVPVPFQFSSLYCCEQKTESRSLMLTTTGWLFSTMTVVTDVSFYPSTLMTSMNIRPI